MGKTIKFGRMNCSELPTKKSGDMKGITLTGKGKVKLQVLRYSRDTNIFCTISVDDEFLIKDVNILNFAHVEYIPYNDKEGEVLELDGIEFEKECAIGFYADPDCNPTIDRRVRFTSASWIKYIAWREEE